MPAAQMPMVITETLDHDIVTTLVHMQATNPKTYQLYQR